MKSSATSLLVTSTEGHLVKDFYIFYDTVDQIKRTTSYVSLIQYRRQHRTHSTVAPTILHAVPGLLTLVDPYDESIEEIECFGLDC